jgi:tripartite-type tricarboxylate transporter receptor subunit TctC
MIAKIRHAVCFMLAGVCAIASACTCAQTVSQRFVRIVTSAPGSSNDWSARLIAQELTKSSGQQAIVENRGNLAVETTARAKPDGSTLLFYGNAVWLQPLLREHSSYDALKDLAPITMATISPILVVVHPSLPVKSMKELIALAKSRPGQINYAAGSIGASPHLSMELLKSMARVDLVRVPYKGTGPAVSAVLAGEVPLMFSPAGSVLTHVKAGRLRALAVASAQRSAVVPHLPTVAESGVPGYESSSLTGVFAPAGTPVELVSRLNEEIVRGLRKPDVTEKFTASGVDVVTTSPEEFVERIKGEIAKWGRVIKATGIREQ